MDVLTTAPVPCRLVCFGSSSCPVTCCNSCRASWWRWCTKQRPSERPLWMRSEFGRPCWQSCVWFVWSEQYPSKSRSCFKSWGKWPRSSFSSCSTPHHFTTWWVESTCNTPVTHPRHVGISNSTPHLFSAAEAISSGGGGILEPRGACIRQLVSSWLQ